VCWEVRKAGKGGAIEGDLTPQPTTRRRHVSLSRFSDDIVRLTLLGLDNSTFGTRFGDIKCIRALDRPIPAGTEITVLYGYDPGTGPVCARRARHRDGKSSLQTEQRERDIS